MKGLLQIGIILCATILIGCRDNLQPQFENKYYNQIVHQLETNPDSALLLFNSINEDSLSEAAFAQKCMLAGKITDKLYQAIIPTHHYERAHHWFSEHGTPLEQSLILLYLGRSYAEDGEYNHAMTTYTKGMNIAEKYSLFDISGLINSYMGDLYESKGMIELAIDKYKTAADLFLKDSNKKSYACALRDCGRSYARIDSIEKAINILLQADSISNEIDNPNVKASIANTIAGTYLLSSNYNEAKTFYNKALLFSKNKTPNYIGLIEVYLATDSLEEAKNLLSKLPQSTSPYIYTLKNLEYEINKKENNYEEALDNLEDCLFLIDSITRAENQSKIYEIEGKYNSLKAKEKVNELMIKNQKHLILTLLIIAVALIVIFILIIQRKRGKEKIQEQKIALDKIKIDFLNLSIELEKQQKQLKSYDDQSEQYTLILNSISLLRENYIKLQHKMVASSNIYKELNLLANKNIPRNDKPLITSRHWELIVKEITEIYPNMYLFINDICPNISEQEWQYCCLSMMEFDSNAEAKLLNINTSSVRTKRLRLRQKLNLTLGSKETFCRHIADKLIP